MDDKIYCVYIVSNWKNTVLYIGVTGNLEERIVQHKEKLTPGFTSKYNIDKLVYFETFGDVELAIEREKQLKKWRRAKKVWLIERVNPEWNDLTGTLFEDSSTPFGRSE